VTVEERFQKIEELLRENLLRSDLNTQQIGGTAKQLGALTEQVGLMSELVHKHDEALDRIERDIQILIDMRRPKNGKTEGNA
jgi:hypothetical protein